MKHKKQDKDERTRRRGGVRTEAKLLVSVIIMAVFVGIRNKDNTLRGLIEYCLLYVGLNMLFRYF